MNHKDASVRIHDVASRAGVSIATVSYVLNAHSGHSISAATTRQVLKAARELNYHLNSHAQHLARRRSNSLGFIISEMTDPFCQDVAKAFEAAAINDKFKVLLRSTECKAECLQVAIEDMLRERVAGVAIVSSMFTKEQLKSFKTMRTPVIMLACGSGIRQSIHIDYPPGILEVIDYSLSLGHRRFSVVVGGFDGDSAAIRRDAIVHSLAQRGLSPHSILECNYRVDRGMSAVRTLMTNALLPTALLCSNDLTAIAVISALAEIGVRVPEDMSVAGVDDVLFARLARPPLTTVHVPRGELGRLAFGLLTDKIRRKKHAVIQLATQAVVRNSISAPRS